MPKQTFQPVFLKTGKRRDEYVRERLLAGVPSAQVIEEINGPDLYSGPPGGKWSPNAVYNIASQLKAEAKTNEEAAGDPSGGLLSPEEIDEIKAKAARKVEDERKKQIRDRIYAEELARLRREEDERIAATPEGELVDLLIDLAPGQAGSRGAYIQLDMPHGEQYFHGRTYRVSRAKADTLREIMFRGKRHEAEIKGELVNFHDRNRNAWVAANGTMSPGATLAGKGIRV